MLKQRYTWFTLASNNPPETMYNIPDILPEIACNVSPQCNFLHRFFQCALPEGTIDVEITVQTLKGIHTFRKDQNAQSSMCNPCGSCIQPFPSLRKNMAAYKEERQTISNHFNWSFPNSSNPSLFVRLPKATLKGKRTKSHPKEEERKLLSKQRGYLQNPVQRKHSADKADSSKVLCNEASYSCTCHGYSHT